MAKKKIDRHQVREARLHGLPNKVIAQRIGCSERQVRRINQDLQHASTSRIAGTAMEHLLWMQYKNGRDYSIRQIAFAFCVSHEHVRQMLIKHHQLQNKEAA